MKKSLLHSVALFVASLALAVGITACATSPPGATPAQQAVNTTASACKNIDASIVAADAAVTSGVLKGKNRENAVKALAAAQAGCVTALAAIQAANAAASGASP